MKRIGFLMNRLSTKSWFPTPGATLIAILLLAPLSWAQTITTNPALTKAKELYVGLQYDDALTYLDRALSKRGNRKENLVEIFSLRGMVLGSLGDDEEAFQNFAKVLVLKPDYKLPAEVSPRISAPYEKALGWLMGKGEIIVKHDPPMKGYIDEDLLISVTVENDPLRMVAGARLYYRIEGQDKYSTVEMRGEGTLQLTVPRMFLASDYEGKAVEYYIEATDEYGGEIAILSSAAMPFRVELFMRTEEEPVAPVVEPKVTPWYATWWFWTAVGGAVVAGTITGIAVGVTQSGSGDPDTVNYDVQVGVTP